MEGNRYLQISTTGIVACLWVISQWGIGAPVPWIGAAMWLAGFDHRPAGAYARAYLVVERKVRDNDLRISRHRQQVVSGLHSPVIRGSMGSPDRHFRKRRGGNRQHARNVTTIILWALWLVIPLGYFAMLLQQVLINPMSLVNPLAGASELIQRYRTRR